jgi:hypothetical protein
MLERFTGNGARLVSWRPRFGSPNRVLIRIEMPDPETTAWARQAVAAAGAEVGGNATPWETQLVFTVPAADLDRHYPGWRTAALAEPLLPALPAAGERRTWREWDADRIRGVRILDPDGFRRDPPGRLYTRGEFLDRRVWCSVTRM